MSKPIKYKEPPPPLAQEPQGEYSRPLSFNDVWIMFQETGKQFQETDRQFKKTDQRLKETDKKMKELQNLFTSQWGRLIESLVEGDLISLLNQRGIEVYETSERKKGSYKCRNYEFDIVAENGAELVFVEVKTTLKPDDVKHFLEKLSMIKTWMPKYKQNTIYGAMAYLKADTGSQTMAGNHGLFVIKATGKSASIVNSPDFISKKF
jgi:Holliday junction resolvase-like predicted endonuclease